MWLPRVRIWGFANIYGQRDGIAEWIFPRSNIRASRTTWSPKNLVYFFGRHSKIVEAYWCSKQHSNGFFLLTLFSWVSLNWRSRTHLPLLMVIKKPRWLSRLRKAIEIIKVSTWLSHLERPAPCSAGGRCSSRSSSWPSGSWSSSFPKRRSSLARWSSRAWFLAR